MTVLTAKNLHDQCQLVRALVDDVVKAARPTVQVASSQEAVRGTVCPKDLRAAAAEVAPSASSFLRLCFSAETGHPKCQWGF